MVMARHKPKAPPSVRKKTEVLIREGEDPRQAYATAWSMKRKNRLTKSGGYRRVKKSRGKRGSRRYNRSRKGR
jgi:hypothetical protein